MRVGSWSHCGAAFAVCGLGFVAAQAQIFSVDVGASADNTMYAENPGNSNGRGPSIFAGSNAGGSPRRALIRFDLVGQIPRYAFINSATLVLHMSRTAGGPKPISVHAALAAWGEGASNAGDPGGSGTLAEPGDATWSDRFFGSQAWTTPGGDFAATASATLSVDGIATYSWVSVGLSQDVANWLADPAVNFGWLLKADEPDLLSTKRFDSRENLVAVVRPVLRVEYSCLSDFNHDGFVTGDDFDEYVVVFEFGDVGADFNHDGFVTGDDFDAFVAAFEDGC